MTKNGAEKHAIQRRLLTYAWLRSVRSLPHHQVRQSSLPHHQFRQSSLHNHQVRQSPITRTVSPTYPITRSVSPPYPITRSASLPYLITRFLRQQRKSVALILLWNSRNIHCRLYNLLSIFISGAGIPRGPDLLQVFLPSYAHATLRPGRIICLNICSPSQWYHRSRPSYRINIVCCAALLTAKNL